MRAFTLLLTVIAFACMSFAATTINEPNKYAWSANVGWINWRADVASGAVIGEYIGSRYLWADSTDPDAGLRITHFFTADLGANTDITWTSRPTRRYDIETKFSLTDAWAPTVQNVVPDPGETTALTLEDTAALQRFYRIRAIRPLAP